MRDDERQMSGWQAPGARVGARVADRQVGKSARRGRTLALAVGAGIVTTALLAACLNAAVVPALARLLATAPTAATSSVTGSREPTAAVSSTAAPEDTATPTSADWRAFTVAGVFRVDVPGVIGSSHGYFINDFSGRGVDLAYMGAPLVTPLQQLEAETAVTIQYSTKITDLNICPQGGTPVQIGSEATPVSAWERDEGQLMAVNLVLNGTAIEIRLSSRDSSQPALPRYAAIWRHMLASFAPLPGRAQATTHPCG